MPKINDISTDDRDRKWKNSDLVNKIISPKPKVASDYAGCKLIDPGGEVWRANRDFAYLHPLFRDQVELLVEHCHEAGMLLYVFEARRSFRRQSYLYEQGRGRKVGPGGKKLKIVTNADAGYSMHNYGLAVDMVFDGDAFKPGMQWSWSGNYQKLGEIIGENFASVLEWAGDWKKFKEYPHVQMRIDYTVGQLKAAYDEAGGGEGGILRVWNLID